MHSTKPKPAHMHMSQGTYSTQFTQALQSFSTTSINIFIPNQVSNPKLLWDFYLFMFLINCFVDTAAIFDVACG